MLFKIKSMEWRRKYKVDAVLQDYEMPEVLTKYFAAGYIGVDKLNSYTVVVRYGLMDLKGILLSAKKRDYLTYVIEIVERSFQRVRNDPKKFKRSPDAIAQSTVIFDMAGFSMRHITYKPGISSCSSSLEFRPTIITRYEPLAVKRNPVLLLIPVESLRKMTCLLDTSSVFQMCENATVQLSVFFF